MKDHSCDYNCGALDEIIAALASANGTQPGTYGVDDICESAKAKIRAAIKNENADIFFLIGGTQTNSAVLSALLAPYEGAVSAATGHIAAHEAGAIEHSGHKVITLPGDECGRLLPETLGEYLAGFYADDTFEHMVRPGTVYISHPTEYGGLYTKAQLLALRELCDKYGMRLYLDGARLAYGLAARDTDVDLPLLAQVCDAFYIGGTKCGALFGEAVVFRNGTTAPHFFTVRKQQGALLAKGWLLGLQFDMLFTDDLYLHAGRRAIDTAALLEKGLLEKGVEFYTKSPTNQLFLVLDNDRLAELDGKVGYSVWEKLPGGRTVVRLCTSWQTTEDDVYALVELF